MDILQLYDKSRHDTLEAQEIAWLETLLNKYPWYSLPYTILAKYHHDNHSTVKDRTLLRAATYAISRSMLREYILGDEGANSVANQPAPEQVTVDESVPETTVTAASEVLETTPETQETLVAELEPVSQEEIQESESEDTENSEIEAVAVKTSETAPVETDEIADSEVEETENEPEITALESENPSEEVEAETPLAEPQSVESELVEAETATISEPVEEKAPVAAFVADPKNQVGRVNWYLETRISLREGQYKRLAERIQAEMAEFATSIAAGPTESAQQATVETKPEESISKDSIEVIQAAEPQPSVERETAETTVVKEITPVPSEEKESIEIAAQKAESKESASENEYRIGAFSGFTFLSAPENEADVEEMDTEIVEAESVELTNEADGGDTGIIFEEKDRVIEITVTQAQLEKYFRGKKPVQSNPSEVMEPFELNSSIIDEKAEVSKPSKEKVDEIIEKFIETDPTISNPTKFVASKGNLAAKSGIAREDIVTETLAKIHAAQGNFAKATKIYKKLSLLFPEKSDYFADQIKNLKK